MTILPKFKVWCLRSNWRIIFWRFSSSFSLLSLSLLSLLSLFNGGGIHFIWWQIAPKLKVWCFLPSLQRCLSVFLSFLLLSLSLSLLFGFRVFIQSLSHSFSIFLSLSSFQMRNFEGWAAVVSGLNQSPIYRLKSLWNSLSSRVNIFVLFFLFSFLFFSSFHLFLFWKLLIFLSTNNFFVLIQRNSTKRDMNCLMNFHLLNSISKNIELYYNLQNHLFFLGLLQRSNSFFLFSCKTNFLQKKIHFYCTISLFNLAVKFHTTNLKMFFLSFLFSGLIVLSQKMQLRELRYLYDGNHVEKTEGLVNFSHLLVCLGKEKKWKERKRNERKRLFDLKFEKKNSKLEKQFENFYNINLLSMIRSILIKHY